MVPTLLHACTLWAQAILHVKEPLLDARCVLELAVDLHRRGVLSPALHELRTRQCRCGKLLAAAPKLLQALSELVAHEEHLLCMAMRQLSVHVKQDRAWTMRVLEVLRPARSCLEVVEAVDSMALPSWLQPHRSAILEACGGRRSVALHRDFVRSMLIDRSPVHHQGLEMLLRHETCQEDRDVHEFIAEPFSVFVPSLAAPLLPHLATVGTQTPLRLRQARLTYHPMTPLLSISADRESTVAGHALTHPSSPAWLRLATMELHIRLGVFHYTCQRQWPVADCDASSAVGPVIVLYSTKASTYPHVTLAPELQVDEAGSVPYLVECRRGNIPVLLSIPHGGSAACRLFGAWQKEHLHLRKPSSTSRKRFTNLSDARTVHVAAGKSVAILAQTAAALATITNGLQPYMVLAKFHRKFVDVNRAVHDDAYMPKKALASRMYAHYHSTLVHVLQEMWLRFPMFDPLLLDIHGQRAKSCPMLGISAADSKDLMYSGTRNGLTLHSVPVFQRQFGSPLHAALQRHGYRGVYPPPSLCATVPERSEFLGGHIVQMYGYAMSRANAMQLELGTHLRGTEGPDDDVESATVQRKRTGAALATAIEAHLHTTSFVKARL